MFGEYRTRSGKFGFVWLFDQQPNLEVRTYVLEAPWYRNMPTTIEFNVWKTAAKLHGDPQSPTPFASLIYDPMPTNLDDAIARAQLWAESIEAYILTSGEF